ncbi:MAG: transcription antitermination factor NusB [Peptostreptococcaceae bacterium]|nr:transcription antitermination factor NusB [Peptostreptococcaceae bacterium]
MNEKEKKQVPKRREQREMAVRMMFEMKSQQEERESFVQNYFGSRDLDIEDHRYVASIARTYIDHMEEIETMLRENIHGWRIERVGKMEINIIRVAAVELLYFDDVPPAVSINEAVEITKKYADEKAYRFVNKVLRNILEASNIKK